MWWRTLLAICALSVASVDGIPFLQVLSVTNLVVKSIWSLWMVSELVPDYLCDNQRELKAKLRTISGQLTTAQDRLLASDDIILRKINSLPSRIKYQVKLDKVFDIVLQLERVERTFEDYMKLGLKDQMNFTNGQKLENDTIMDFLHNVLSHHPGSVRSNMDKLHQIIVVDDSRTIFLRSGLFSIFTKHLQVIY